MNLGQTQKYERINVRITLHSYTKDASYESNQK